MGRGTGGGDGSGVVTRGVAERLWVVNRQLRVRACSDGAHSAT